MDLVAWAVALWLRLDPPPPALPCPRRYPCQVLGYCVRKDKGGPCDRRRRP